MESCWECFKCTLSHVALRLKGTFKMIDSVHLEAHISFLFLFSLLVRTGALQHYIVNGRKVSMIWELFSLLGMRYYRN